MKRTALREDTGRVLALAAGLWAAVIAIAAFDGALARFDGSSLAVLAALVSLFAVASYLLDPQLRAYAGEMDAARAWAFAVALGAAFLLATALGSVPFAMLFAPLASLAAAAAALRPRRRRARSAAPAKSPGATTAAT
jgi:hypothetical protein